MLFEGRVGIVTGADGVQEPVRLSRTLAQVITQGHGRYVEPALRGNIFSLALNTTSSTIAAGNIVAAAAAASTQFAIWNPNGSGVNFALLKFGMGVISGTPPAGPLFHGVFVDGNPTVASTGTIRNNLLNGPASRARCMASAGGAALTGGTAPQLLRVADFSQTATAAASAQALRAVEIIDGEIVIPPGAGWVPLWSGAGTTLLNGYSVTWEEIPV